MRAPLLLLVLASVGCASFAPQFAQQWRGETRGLVRLRLALDVSQLPAKAWLVRAPRSQSQGRLSWRKWTSYGAELAGDDDVAIRDTCPADGEYVGVIDVADGRPQLCIVNPEHGGFETPAGYAFTYTYDYCAALEAQ